MSWIDELITKLCPEGVALIKDASYRRTPVSHPAAAEARRYLATSLKREFASENGTELNSILPKMSPLNPHYLTKKQSVFQKIAAFVEKFKGVGGSV